MARKRFLIIVLGCLMINGAGCDRVPPEELGGPQSLPALEVKVVAVTEQPARRRKEVTGTVEAVQRATIAARVTGTIEKLPVEIGSVVSRGELLILISAEEINARVAQARAQVDQARRNFEREKRLLAKEASTPQTVEAMEDVYRVAKAGFDEAQTMLGYTTITAPFGGVIAAKIVQAGDLATPGTPLLVLENTGRLKVVASVPEALTARIKIGDTLPVLNSGSAPDGEGVVAEIAPTADPMSRTTTVKLDITNASGMRPGQYVKVVLPGNMVNTLLVPTVAVNRYGQMERLFVVEDNSARLRLVRTGEQYGEQVEILAGLTAGEQVIIEGSNQLVDGQPLQIVP